MLCLNDSVLLLDRPGDNGQYVATPSMGRGGCLPHMHQPQGYVCTLLGEESPGFEERDLNTVTAKGIRLGHHNIMERGNTSYGKG